MGNGKEGRDRIAFTLERNSAFQLESGKHRAVNTFVLPYDYMIGWNPRRGHLRMPRPCRVAFNILHPFMPQNSVIRVGDTP